MYRSASLALLLAIAGCKGEEVSPQSTPGADPTTPLGSTLPTIDTGWPVVDTDGPDVDTDVVDTDDTDVVDTDDTDVVDTDDTDVVDTDDTDVVDTDDTDVVDTDVVDTDTDVVDTDTVDTVDTADTDGGGVTFDPNTDITVDWDAVETAGNVTIDIANTDATGFSVGFAETAAGGSGWYGEDCINNACHSFLASTTGSLAYVDLIGDVVPGTSTLFDGGTDGVADAFDNVGGDRLTYIVTIVGGTHDGECFVWGQDPSYFASASCTVL